jgi:hypothetical protein
LGTWSFPCFYCGKAGAYEVTITPKCGRTWFKITYCMDHHAKTYEDKKKVEALFDAHAAAKETPSPL